MLNVRPQWTGAFGRSLAERLDAIDARAGASVAIGGQTRYCMESLRAKIDWRLAANSCGNL